MWLRAVRRLCVVRTLDEQFLLCLLASVSRCPPPRRVLSPSQSAASVLTSCNLASPRGHRLTYPSVPLCPHSFCSTNEGLSPVFRRPLSFMSVNVSLLSVFQVSPPFVRSVTVTYQSPPSPCAPLHAICCYCVCPTTFCLSVSSFLSFLHSGRRCAC